MQCYKCSDETEVILKEAPTTSYVTFTSHIQIFESIIVL